MFAWRKKHQQKVDRGEKGHAEKESKGDLFTRPSRGGCGNPNKPCGLHDAKCLRWGTGKVRHRGRLCLVLAANQTPRTTKKGGKEKGDEGCQYVCRTVGGLEYKHNSIRVQDEAKDAGPRRL